MNNRYVCFKFKGGRQNKKTIGLILCTLLLSGCSSYNSDFDCPAGSGVGCKSVSKVNTLVEYGYLPNDLDDTAVPDSGSKVISEGPIELNHCPSMHTTYGAEMRVWFASDIDDKGRDGRDLYTSNTSHQLTEQNRC